MERKSKGVWIPLEIFDNKEVCWTAKILFMQIDSFTENGKECFFSNAHLAEKMGVSGTQISKHINKLIEIGWIKQVGFDGRKRYLESCLDYGFKADLNQSLRQKSTEVQGSMELEFKDIKESTNKKNIPIDLVDKVLKHLNKKTEKEFRPVEANAKFIRARIKEGYKLGDLIHVIDVKTEQWLNTEQDKYLRPATLFSATNFQGYVQEKQSVYVRPKTEVEQAHSNL